MGFRGLWVIIQTALQRLLSKNLPCPSPQLMGLYNTDNSQILHSFAKYGGENSQHRKCNSSATSSPWNALDLLDQLPPTVLQKTEIMTHGRREQKARGTDQGLDS